MAGMESFQLLDMDNEDDLDLTHVPLDSGTGKVVRAGDPRRTSDGSLESLHFSFDNNRSAGRIGQPKNCFCTWKTWIGLLLLGGLCMLLGFVGCRFSPVSYDPEINSPPWQEKIRFIPDFARCRAGFDRPVVVVVSMDGLRYDLVERMPALQAVATAGLHAPHMRSVFPTATFPNHFSIVTGLYPESHGIIDNTFLSSDLKRTFAVGSEESFNPAWWKGTPIWKVAEAQRRRVSTHYWPGSDVTGMRPTSWMNFSKTESVESRAQSMVDQLLLPKDQRPHLMLTYYQEPDCTGHNFGVFSDEYKAALASADRLVDHLMQGLAQHDLLDCVDVLFISDHGVAQFANVSDPVYGALKSKFPGMDLSPTVFHEGVGPLNRLNPAGVSVPDVVQALACETDSAPYQVYAKQDLPRRYHYFNSAEIWPVILTANVSRTLHHIYRPPYALHGWDSLYSEMWASFVATGPSFRRNVTMEPFLNVELFGMLCKLLKIEPVANNGTEGSLEYVLREQGELGRRRVAVMETYQFPGSLAGWQSLCQTGCVKAVIPSRIPMSPVASQFGVLGVPEPPAASRSMAMASCDFSTGFSQTRNGPLWTAFHLDARSSRLTNLGQVFDQDVDCLYENPSTTLLGPRLTCEAKQTVAEPKDDGSTRLAYLFPPGLASTVESTLFANMSSNVVTMYRSFRSGVWRRFWQLAASWVDAAGPLRVVLGPVFDSQPPFGFADDDSDTGSSKSSLPSHFFVILTRDRLEPPCDTESCRHEVQAFVLPHRPAETHPCQKDGFYFLTHSATVKDVELLTGLNFFTNLSVNEAARLKTRLTDSLWNDVPL